MAATASVFWAVAVGVREKTRIISVSKTRMTRSLCVFFSNKNPQKGRFFFWPPPQACFGSWRAAPEKKPVLFRFRKLGHRGASVFFFSNKTAQKARLFFVVATASVSWVVAGGAREKTRIGSVSKTTPPASLCGFFSNKTAQKTRLFLWLPPQA